MSYNYNEKIIYGFSDIYYSIDGTNIYPLKGGVDISVSYKEDNLYANISGINRIKLSKPIVGEGNLNLLGLTFKEMKDILGYSGEEGELYMSDSYNPPYLSLLFKREKANGESLYTILYKCRFDITDLNASTIQDAIEQNNIELKFNCIPDEKRYNLNYFILDTEKANKDKADNFFNKIQIPEGVK